MSLAKTVDNSWWSAALGPLNERSIELLHFLYTQSIALCTNCALWYSHVECILVHIRSRSGLCGCLRYIMHMMIIQKCRLKLIADLSYQWYYYTRCNDLNTAWPLTTNGTFWNNILTKSTAWLKTYLHRFIWDVIAHPWPNFDGRVTEWMNNCAHRFMFMQLLIYALSPILVNHF